MSYTKDAQGNALRDGSSCPYDPIVLTPYPIGMHHCPYCGVMVVPGAPHPSDEDIRKEHGEGLLPFRQERVAYLEQLAKEKK